MVNSRYLNLGSQRSVIRELFEYGNKRKAEIGEENVFDFSLGNPSIAPPKSVNSSIKEIIDNNSPLAVHGYTSAQGDASVRQIIADKINRDFSVGINKDLIYLTCGAAASLTISLCALINEGEKVLAFQPYFPEYKVFAETAGAIFDTVLPDSKMHVDFCDLEKKLDPSVKAVIINSPNNPSGVVYSEQEIKKLAELLQRKQAEYNHEIYIISDEPYRELSYGDNVPYVMNYYDNTVVCYSYSKSLSLAGERIGYIAVSPKVDKDVYFAVMGAGRALGYVCAPSIFQRVIKANIDAKCDVLSYKKNRDFLCKELGRIGFEFAEPEGAFYLFVKAPDGDGDRFSELAKKHELLIVSGRGFGVATHARISYCVSFDTIKNSIPQFEKLMQEYKK